MLPLWCVVRKTCSDAGCTWSRLFHTRKRFLSDFRPWTWSGHDSQTEVTNIRPTDKSRYKSSDADRRQHFYQDKSHNNYRGNTSEERRDRMTRHWKAQQSEDRSYLQKPDYRRQRQSFRDSERLVSEESNPHRPSYRNSFRDSHTIDQNLAYKSDNRSDRPHYRHWKTKKRVLTERELREEEEFKKSSIEEIDASDRFGDYGEDTGNKHEQYKTDDKDAHIENRTRHEQYQREAPQRNWSETFGTISLEDKPSLGDVLFGKEPPPSSAADRIPAEERFDDEDDGVMEKPHIPLSRINRKHIPNWYARRIEKLGEKGMVKEALDLFEKQMIETDRVKPTHYEFGLMISLLGRVGYVQKAFNFFYQMQKMDLVPEPKVYTSLFNACAKSSIKSYGLQRAHKLRYHMIEQSIEPTLITYQAMISAFGMCGDTEMAFSLLDEVLLKHRPNQNLLCSALVACISDKQAGFRHALLVWRKLVKRGVKPDLASYNLLLRAIKECGVGPLTGDNNLLLIETENQEAGSRHGHNPEEKKIVSSLQMKVDPDNQDSVSFVEVIEGVEPSHSMKDSLHGSITNAKSIQNSVGKETMDNDRIVEADKPLAVESVKHWWEYDLGKLIGLQSDAVVRQGVRRDMSDILPLDPEMMPNILNPFDRSLQVVSLGHIETMEDRLALCGGAKGYLSSIEMEGIKPDLVTFIQLVSIATQHEEDEILEMMPLYNVKPDIDFFNHLIKKKAYRHDNQAALDIRELIEEYGLVPNIQTYGCLAKVCGTRGDGEKLLQDMADANIQPNTTILHSLVRNSGYNFLYKSWLLNQMRLLGIPADTEFINMVEKYISKIKKVIVQKERGEAVPRWSQAPDFEPRFWNFMDFYNRWVTEIEFQKEEHPWAQFQDRTEEADTDRKHSNVT